MVAQSTRSGMVILDPTSAALPVDARLATRPVDLNGKELSRNNLFFTTCSAILNG